MSHSSLTRLRLCDGAVARHRLAASPWSRRIRPRWCPAQTMSCMSTGRDSNVGAVSALPEEQAGGPDLPTRPEEAVPAVRQQHREITGRHVVATVPIVISSAESYASRSISTTCRETVPGDGPPPTWSSGNMTTTSRITTTTTCRCRISSKLLTKLPEMKTQLR